VSGQGSAYENPSRQDSHPSSSQRTKPALQAFYIGVGVVVEVVAVTEWVPDVARGGG
jgi:hypothetical protein